MEENPFLTNHIRINLKHVCKVHVHLHFGPEATKLGKSYMPILYLFVLIVRVTDHANELKWLTRCNRTLQIGFMPITFKA